MTSMFCVCCWSGSLFQKGYVYMKDDVEYYLSLGSRTYGGLGMRMLESKCGDEARKAS